MTEDTERAEPEPRCEEAPRRPARRPAWPWEGPDGGPDDPDAIHDLRRPPSVPPGARPVDAVTP